MKQILGKAEIGLENMQEGITVEDRNDKNNVSRVIDLKDEFS